MSLTEKLAHLPAWRVAPGRPQLVERVCAPASTLPGVVQETEHGPVHLVEQSFDAAHLHGRASVQGALAAAPHHLARLSLNGAFAAFSAADCRKLIYLDTETTGLHGGAGTLPFLVGMAWFADRRFVVQQLFLQQPGQEGPLLHWVAKRLREASCLVTFNGKTFDWPLLRTRFVLNRVSVPENLPPHLDLLHCARRVFKGTLEDLRLKTVERGVLGFVRDHDIDGSLIPEIYWRFLRSGDARALPGVFEHNSNDVIALAALLGELVRRVDDPVQISCARERLAWAELAWRNGEREHVIDWVEAALEGARQQGQFLLRGQLLAATLHLRRNNVAQAAALLQEILNHVGPEELRRRSGVHLMLSKLYEHRRRDWEAALVHAQHTCLAEGRDRHEQRIKRLHGKLRRRAQQVK